MLFSHLILLDFFFFVTEKMMFEIWIDYWRMFSYTDIKTVQNNKKKYIKHIKRVRLVFTTEWTIETQEYNEVVNHSED